MGGRLGVAQQHDIFVGPARAADGRKIAPDRAVHSELVAVELARKHIFEETGGRPFVKVCKPGPRKGLGVGLHHPGRAAWLVLIAVGNEDAVLGFAEEEREGVERAGRSHPRETVGPQFDARSEMFGICLSDLRVDAVGTDHEIGVADLGGRYLVLELQLDAEPACALTEQVQERHAGAAAEAVAADAVDRILEMDFDVVPVGEILRNGAVALAIVGLEGFQRLVGEHDAEAERIVGPVALEHGDPRLRPRLLHQDREIKPGRTAADDVNLHAHLLTQRRPRSGSDQGRKKSLAPLGQCLKLIYFKSKRSWLQERFAEQSVFAW